MLGNDVDAVIIDLDTPISPKYLTTIEILKQEAPRRLLEWTPIAVTCTGREE